MWSFAIIFSIVHLNTKIKLLSLSFPVSDVRFWVSVVFLVIEVKYLTCLVFIWFVELDLLIPSVSNVDCSIVLTIFFHISWLWRWVLCSITFLFVDLGLLSFSFSYWCKSLLFVLFFICLPARAPFVIIALFMALIVGEGLPKFFITFALLEVVLPSFICKSSTDIDWSGYCNWSV